LGFTGITSILPAWTNTAKPTPTPGGFNLTGMINWYRALFKSQSSTRRKAKIELPVLILWGKQDLALGAQMAEKSQRLNCRCLSCGASKTWPWVHKWPRKAWPYCKNGELVFFENATHWVQHDEAEAVTKKLLEFLKQA
jgi:epoxide hydrolase 4